MSQTLNANMSISARAFNEILQQNCLTPMVMKKDENGIPYWEPTTDAIDEWVEEAFELNSKLECGDLIGMWESRFLIAMVIIYEHRTNWEAKNWKMIQQWKEEKDWPEDSPHPDYRIIFA